MIFNFYKFAYCYHIVTSDVEIAFQLFHHSTLFSDNPGISIQISITEKSLFLRRVYLANSIKNLGINN